MNLAMPMVNGVEVVIQAMGVANRVAAINWAARVISGWISTTFGQNRVRKS